MASTASMRSRGGLEPIAGRRARSCSSPGPAHLLESWLLVQGVNLVRHANALRPFRREEFGTGPAAPSEAHVDAANAFIGGLRAKLLDRCNWVAAAAAQARRDPRVDRLAALLSRKDAVGAEVLYVEGIWDFYFDLFVQRLSAFGERLRAVDRISANCYEDLYLGLGTARPAPTLLPFSYAASGFSPYTLRRGVPMKKLRHHPNLFPLVVIPQHRLDNVWALSSVLHETSHNLQADLGLWDVMPKLIFDRLTAEGLGETVARVWSRWHKEITADMLALVLGGPAAVESLMDVVGRSRRSTIAFDPSGVHPTSVLRVPISLTLLRRLGCPEMAEDLAVVWRALYPGGVAEGVPAALVKTFDRAAELTVDTIVFQPRPEFTGKSISQLVAFGPAEMALIRESGEQMAAGKEPASTPPRLMMSAARHALVLDRARPEAITTTFYKSLGRR